jgi:WD40 repeat protein
VLSVAFSPDGQLLATAAACDPTVRLWDTATGLERMSLRGPADMAVSVVFAPDGATLASGDSRGNVTLWDLESGRPRASWNAHSGSTKSLAFSADGRTLASVGDGTVKLWEMHDGRQSRVSIPERPEPFLAALVLDAMPRRGDTHGNPGKSLRVRFRLQFAFRIGNVSLVPPRPRISAART